MRRAITVSDLGFGDAGKGSCVDYLCEYLGADLVVRFCGARRPVTMLRFPETKALSIALVNLDLVRCAAFALT